MSTKYDCEQTEQTEQTIFTNISLLEIKKLLIIFQLIQVPQISNRVRHDFFNFATRSRNASQTSKLFTLEKKASAFYLQSNRTHLEFHQSSQIELCL